MFGLSRRKGRRAAIEATWPLIKMLEISGPLPAIFWNDPYALGFLWWTAGLFAKAATGGKLKGADMGYCLIDTWSTISGRDGKEISKRASNLAESKDPQFFEGVSAAEKVIAITYGSRDYDDDPDVIAACKMADSIGNSLDIAEPSDRRTRISASLSMIVFSEKMKQRLGLNADA